MIKVITATRARKPQSTVDEGTRGEVDNSSLASTTGRKTAPQLNTKTSRVIALLQQPDGATVEELLAETGWKPHTMRAALTGLRKKGHEISSDKVDGSRRYTARAAK